MASVVKLPRPQDFLATDDDQQLIIGQPQHLVGRKQPAAAKALRISVLGNDLGNGDALPGRHGGVDLHRHVSAPDTEIFRRHIVCAAQHQLRVRIAYQFRPEVVGIAVLDLRQVLAAHQDLEGPGADGAQTPGKVRDDTDVVHLVQNDIHRHWAPLFRRTVSVADQLDEQEGEKKGRQKFQRGVLVIQDDVIYAFGLPGKSEVDVGLAGDTSDSLALEHLQSGTQAQDHTGPHGIAGLAEQAVGCPGRMVQR